MKLTELRPELKAEGALLIFDCPTCRGKPEAHKIRIGLAPPMGPGKVPALYTTWQRTGDSFETLTLAPSIEVPRCWHGHIINGEALFA